MQHSMRTKKCLRITQAIGETGKTNKRCCGKFDGNFKSTGKIQNKKKHGEKKGKQTSTVALLSEKRLHNQQACPRRPDSQER